MILTVARITWEDRLVLSFIVVWCLWFLKSRGFLEFAHFLGFNMARTAPTAPR